MKRIISVLLLLCVLCSLASCGGKTDKKDFTRGTVTENVYTSDFCGLTFTAPAGWQFYSDEEIAALMNVTADQLSDEKMKDAMFETVIDFYAYDETTGNNVNATFENLNVTQRLTVTDDAYVLQFTNVLVGQYESLGFTVETEDKGTVRLGGTEYRKLEIVLNGGALRQGAYIRRFGSQYLAIAVSVFDGTPLSELEKAFS